MATRPIDLEEAQAFLSTLDPEGAFTFQTFDDGPKPKRAPMAQLMHGRLKDHSFRLQRLNADGAGVYVTVNETDLKGREYENVRRVRALFVDLDGSPLDPVRSCALTPHMLVESSGGRWHAYWLVEACELEHFKPLQRGLATRFQGDRSVVDLPRVMRLPGFWHCKGEPYQTNVIELNERPPYRVDEVLDAFGWDSVASAEAEFEEQRRRDAEAKGKTAKANPQASAPMPSTDADIIDDLRDALLAIPVNDDDREQWISLGLALRTLGQQGLSLWLDWSARSKWFDAAGAVQTWGTFEPTQTSYKAVFSTAKTYGWNPANAPSIQRKRALRRASAPTPPPETEAPAPDDAVVLDSEPDALLHRYELIYGTKQVWDTKAGLAMQFAAFVALIGKKLANEWMSNPRRRVRMMPAAKDKNGDAPPPKPPDTTKVDSMLPRYALIYGQEAVFDREHRRELGLGALRAYVGLKAVRDWGDHPKREVVLEDQVVFDPRRSLDDLSVCNLWAGWPYEPDPGSANDQELVERWLRVLHYACGESENVFEWVLKWIAYPLQHPGTKMRSSIVMHGPEGSGKNTVWDAVRRIYKRYGIQIGQTQLEQQWCDWISAKLFIVGNEVLHRQEQVQQKGRLKSLITEQTIRVERKFMNGRDELNFANMVFLSNELRPLSLDPEDRRFLIVWTPPAHPDGYAFYKGLGEDSMQESTVRALYRYFLTVNLDGFDAHTKPPMTAAKRDLIDASLESHQRFVRDWLAGGLPIACRPCRSQLLYRAYLFWCRENGERFPKAENLFANRAKKEMPFGIKRYLPPETADGVAKQATFYLPETATPPPGQGESAWLGKEDSFFRKDLEQWRNDQ